MGYYVNEIPNNKNINKYFYINKVNGILEIKDGKWFYNLSFFCINNFNLPLNSLLFDLCIPSQTVSEIYINLSPDQSAITNDIENYQYCKIYDCNFQIVVDGDKYFEQPLNQAMISHKVYMNFDPNPLNSYENKIQQDILDKMMNEVYNQKLSFDLIYSNIYYANNQLDCIDVDYKYDLYSQSISNSKIININYEMKNYQNSTNSIITLCSISSANYFNIIKTKVDFFYSINKNETKNLSYEVNAPTLKVNNFTLDFVGCTSFDSSTNIIIHNLDGLRGFFSPKNCTGYYTVELLIEINSVIKKIFFQNNYNFKDSIINFLINIQPTVINDLRKFKKVIF